MLLVSMVMAIASVVTVRAVLPYLDRATYVIFEVEKSTGIVRMVHQPDKPFNPDARVREYFINQMVVLMESFVRADVDRMANVLRHYVTADILERYIANMRATSEALKRATYTVEVEAVLPITPHESGQALNQSTVDFTVRTEGDEGAAQVRRMVAIVTYRFVPYTKAELASIDPDMRDKIRKNPLGMEVVEYRVDARLPKERNRP